MAQTSVSNHLQQNCDGSGIAPTSNDLAIVLQCLVRQLAPFSPQPAIRQAQIFDRYIATLHRYQLQHRSMQLPDPEIGMITGDGGTLINLEWIKNFTDCQRICTFPGLALSSLAYGTSSMPIANHNSNGFELQTFSSIENDAHPVFPSNGTLLLVWNELQQILLESVQKETANSANCCSAHSALFHNEFTNNERACLLPAGEPFIVRIRMQNPFPFPLTIRSLCLSTDKIMLRKRDCSSANDDKLQCSVISELELAPMYSDQDREIQDKDTQQARDANNHQLVDLQVMPGMDTQSFAVNGIKFELCSTADSADQCPPSISAFVPISIRGKRLFKTKEHRMTKMYGMDNRLNASVRAEPAPLLSFRPIGGEPGLIKAVTRDQPVEAFCDQIVQISFEIENVGQMPVEQFRFCTNMSENVSISEASAENESATHLIQCPAKVRQCALLADDPYKTSELGMDAVLVGQIERISAKEPLEIGAKIGMRVAIRIGEHAQLFYFLFLYIGENGTSRQFRFSVRTRPHPRMFTARLRALSPSIGLHMLELNCFPSAQSTTFTKLELLRLSIRYTDGKCPKQTTITRLNDKPIRLECATKQNLCFYAHPENLVNESHHNDSLDGEGWSHTWLGKTFVPDIPNWQLSHQIEQRTVQQELSGFVGSARLEETGNEENENGKMQPKLLWKASIVRSDGTVNAIFGELIMNHS